MPWQVSGIPQEFGGMPWQVSGIPWKFGGIPWETSGYIGHSVGYRGN